MKNKNKPTLKPMPKPVKRKPIPMPVKPTPAPVLPTVVIVKSGALYTASRKGANGRYTRMDFPENGGFAVETVIAGVIRHLGNVILDLTMLDQSINKAA